MRRLKTIVTFSALAGCLGLAFACGQTPDIPQAAAAKDPIAAREYEVYAALFAVEAPGGLNSPQFFDAVPDARMVSGTTLDLDDPKARIWPVEGFGPVDKALVKDYHTKNLKAWPIKGPIAVQGVVILTPEELDKRLKAAMEAPGETAGHFGFSGTFLSLSRVGFNASGELALVSAAVTWPRAMRAQYLVLMKKTAEGWRLENVMMEDLLYH